MKVGIPVGVALVAVAAAAVTPSLASAQTESLTPVSPQALVAAVLGARPQQFAGTIQATSNLLGSQASLLSGVQGSSQSVAIPQGTASVRVWRGAGADLRVSVLNAASERDLYVTADGAWVWDSSGSSVVHLVASRSAAAPSSASSASSATFDPTTAAAQLLARLSVDSSVRLGQNTYVAGRAAYTLVVTPTQAGTTVGSITFDVDAATDAILGASVTNQAGATVLSWQFTSIAFAPQPASIFAFTPPAGSHVTTRTIGQAALGAGGMGALGVGWSATPPSSSARVLGSGWDRVAVVSAPSRGQNAGSSSLAVTLRALEEPVVLPSGQSAELVRSTLVNALILPSGTTLVGAVTPSVLEADVAAING